MSAALREVVASAFDRVISISSFLKNRSIAMLGVVATKVPLARISKTRRAHMVWLEVTELTLRKTL